MRNILTFILVNFNINMIKFLKLDLLKKPYVIAVLVALVTYLLMFLDCKVSNKERSTATYCKNITYVSGLSAGIAYLFSMDDISLDMEIDTRPPSF